MSWLPRGLKRRLATTATVLFILGVVCIGLTRGTFRSGPRISALEEEELAVRILSPDELLRLGAAQLRQAAKNGTTTVAAATATERRLRVFMPADGPNINLCKTVMSAVAMGYPMPTLLNWDGAFNRPEWHFRGSHIAKLESLLAVIEDLLGQADEDNDVDEDDLALLVDAYDIWFQLPPSVLIQRYHRLNQEADRRNREHWESISSLQNEPFPIAPPRQDIIVTTAKDCGPDSESGSYPNYAHWPASPMRGDLYGDGTDELLPYSLDPARKYRKLRPRCVNSGVIMGTMGGLRAALQRCRDKIQDVERRGRQLWSDQALLAEVIGDQEMWRGWVDGLHTSWQQNNGEAAIHDASNLSTEVRPIAREALEGRRFDFSIGLDYNFTTIPPTCSAEEDGDFVILNEKNTIEEASLAAGLAPGDVRVQTLPETTDHDDGVLGNVDWASVPLYADMYFGVAPVGIHHNAYIDGLKHWRLRHWWDRMWYYPRLREIVTQRLQNNTARAHPLVVMRPDLASPDGNSHEEVTYWAPRRDYQGHHSVTVFDPAADGPDRYRAIGWDGVCQKGGAESKWYDELFGDGKGEPVF